MTIVNLCINEILLETISNGKICFTSALMVIFVIKRLMKVMCTNSYFLFIDLEILLFRGYPSSILII